MIRNARFARTTSSVVRLVICRFSSQKSGKENSGRSKRYSNTLNLPKTKFPLSLKHGASNRRELEIQKVCDFGGLYNWQENQGRQKLFVLHDGPPYANGAPHVGHALNKVLKDITNRYRLLRGHRVHYVPGWDCHGLPIEMKALSANEDFRTMTAIDIRAKAREFATAAIQQQKEAFQRWGVMANWGKCYLTMDREYQASQLDIFYNLYKQGLVYRDNMPVYWSTSARTAIAEAELEYNDHHVSTAVYVRFPLRHMSHKIRALVGSSQCYGLIWTTTPWTLPANKAICYSPSMRYTVIRGESTRHTYLCAEELLDKMRVLLGEEVKVLDTILGSDLAGVTYSHPLYECSDLPFLPADHVTTDKGTGLVHTAPAHGHDDFKVAHKHGLSVTCMVDEDGLFTEEAGPQLSGHKVLDEANKTVMSLLGDNVIHSEELMHSYPYDWRTKLPVIIRTSKQWFVNTRHLQAKALECLKGVQIQPKSSERGMSSQLESRTYWCISRQRAWGLPIPVFYNTRTGDAILNDASMNHVRGLILEHGADCWWSLTHEELFPQHIAEQAGLNCPEDCVRGEDILDIWFDSGSSWYSVLKDVGCKADVYLEGVDQFRGWFQSSLLTSIALHNTAPYRSLVVHGFALDEQGKKMSKSEGNVVDPDTVINGGKKPEEEPAYGVDVLRWWVAASHPQSNVTIGPNILNQCYETVFKIRKSMRFLLGNLFDFNPKTDLVPYTLLLPQDQYMLHLLYILSQQITSSYEDYNYSRIVQSLEKFVNVQVSNFYSTVCKDRCYCGSVNDGDRISSQTAQYYVLDVLSKALAPILPHLAEELYLHYPGLERKVEKKTTADMGDDVRSIFRTIWCEPDTNWCNPVIQNKIDAVLSIRDSLYSAIGPESPNEFDVIIHSSGTLYDVLKFLQSEQSSCTSPLCELLQTSQTSVINKPPPSITDDYEIVEGSCLLQGEKEPIPYTAIILPAENDLCQRCRRYTAPHKQPLCHRCVHVIEHLNPS